MPSPAWYPTPESPLRKALQVVTGELFHDMLKGVYEFNDIADPELQEELHEWCGYHARPDWATGLSMIEAAELIVRQAVENANIHDFRVEA